MGLLFVGVETNVLQLMLFIAGIPVMMMMYGVRHWCGCRCS
jgi:hypothetical protein